MKSLPAIFALLMASFATAQPGVADKRQLVELPAPMAQHMLANMRDHLQSLVEIQKALGAGNFDVAAGVAEKRLGMSSLDAHGAAHMAAFMPKGMQDSGTQMHRAASRFALVAQEAGAGGSPLRPMQALAAVTEQCVACHAAYRVH